MAEGAGAVGNFVGETRQKMRFIVGASSAGTIIEWYDFYLYGALTFVLAPIFTPVSNDATLNFLVYLATFATGFAVRPFGAVVFGRIGDLIGRKYAFLLTVTIMGGGTAAIGVLPGFSQIGILPPIVLVLLRLVQGLALGGEYGGAVIYVAEHAPDSRRGYWTSFIQTTATVGLFISIGVVGLTNYILGDTAFKSWGWRIPFLLSIALVSVSLVSRWRLKETHLFARIKAAGRTSRTPLREALASWANWKLILLALFGATSGQAVVWYTGQFFAPLFMQKALGISLATSNVIMFTALVLATPFFLVWGHLSDRIGRKKIIMFGCALAVVTYYPLYLGMAAFSKPPNIPVLVGLVFVQVFYVTMVYGPIAALLVEMFPARIRYTCLSLPYHLGNGEFGGATILIPFVLNAAFGNIFIGLVWCISVPLMTLIIGQKYLKETKDVRIWEEVSLGPALGGSASMPRTGTDVGQR